MRIPEHWQRVAVDLEGVPREVGGFVAYGWSDTSAAEAEAMALERAQAVAKRFRDDGEGAAARGGSDYYLDRPICEPVEQWIGDAADPAGAVTRNGYGAWVLNAARVMFIDVDVPPATPGGGGLLAWLQGLFGGAEAPEDPAVAVEARLREVIAQESALGLRLYRTHSGFRVLVTSQLVPPESPTARLLLQAFDADPLYRRLCAVQRCYRARLTAKPWRVGLDRPPLRRRVVPVGPARQSAQAAWDQDYAAAREGTVVCRVVLDRPQGAMPAEVAQILKVHDRWCLGTGRLA